MLVVPTYIAPSPIEGIGLFAAAPIAAGAVIWTPRYDRAFSPADIEEMPPLFRSFVEKYGYVDVRYPGVWFCALDNGRFMNHDAAAPSTIPSGDMFVAARDLAAGDELTYDYEAL